MTTTTVTLKCRKCRKILIETPIHHILDAHSNSISRIPSNSNSENNCITLQEQNELYLAEDNLPIWTTNQITSTEWTKGKLKCENCDGRIGSFDFVSGNRCKCLQCVLPSVHLVKSKVDYSMNNK